jgi:hypothetical protein
MAAQGCSNPGTSMFMILNPERVSHRYETLSAFFIADISSQGLSLRSNSGLA